MSKARHSSIPSLQSKSLKKSRVLQGEARTTSPNRAPLQRGGDGVRITKHVYIVVSGKRLETALRSAFELIPDVVCESFTLNQLSMIGPSDGQLVRGLELKADSFLVVDAKTEGLPFIRPLINQLKSRVIRLILSGERVARLNRQWFKLDPNAPLLEVVESLRIWMHSAGNKVFESASGRRPVGNLQVREIQILELLASGKRYVDIANHLGISLDTVRSHLRRIYPKLGVQCRTAAVSVYIRRRASFEKHFRESPGSDSPSA